MVEMSSKLTLIAPEIVIFTGAVVVAVLGLARNRVLRDAVPWVSIAFLVGSVIATFIVYCNEEATEAAGLILPNIGGFVKTMVGLAGIGLVMLGIGT